MIICFLFQQSAHLAHTRSLVLIPACHVRLDPTNQWLGKKSALNVLMVDQLMPRGQLQKTTARVSIHGYGHLVGSNYFCLGVSKNWWCVVA